MVIADCVKLTAFDDPVPHSLKRVVQSGRAMPPCPKKWWGYSPTSPTVCPALVSLSECTTQMKYINMVRQSLVMPCPMLATELAEEREARLGNNIK